MDELIVRFLRGELTETEEQRLLVWRQESRRHEARYQEFAQVWRLSNALSSSLYGSIPSTEAILERESDDTSSNVVARPTRMRWLYSAAAAAAVLVAAVGVYHTQANSDADSALVVAEYVAGSSPLSVPLGDGSVIRLAPSSRLRVAGTPSSREVWLEGRAYFAVAKRAGETFKVRTRAGDAVVLGTRFDLDVHNQDLRLVVVEGRVGLSDGEAEVTVDAGEVSAVVDGKVVGVVPLADTRALVGWVGAFLVFDDTPLADVADDIARVYGVEVRIDETMRRRTITGWFSDQEYHEVAAAVCRVIKARCTVADSLWVMHR